MKKLRLRGFIVLLCAFTALFAASCSSGSPELGITNVLPWQQAEEYTHEETLEYRFIRYYGSDEVSGSNPDNTPLIITNANSRQVYNLKEGKSLDFDEDKLEYTEITDNDSTLLTMSLTVNYLSDDFVPELLRGKTETIESAVVFSKYSSSLDAKFMFKTVRYADAENNGNYSVATMYTDYAGTSNFTGTKKAVFIKGGEKKQKNVGGTHFDNEYVLFLVRSLDTVKNAASMQKSFKAAVTADNFKNNKKFAATPFIQKTAAALENISVSEDVYRFFYATTEDITDFSVPCYFTQISIDAKKSGPPKTVYYSSVNINKNTLSKRPVEAQKVPVKIRDYLYTQSGRIEYTQVYELTDYSNTYK